MFLATTALSEFWSPSQETLCLGSWCLRHDRRAEWAQRNCRVLPCLWDDRARFYQAAQEADRASEHLLQRLSDYLNAAHGVSYPERYWRILIGPWLMHYTHAIYDRSLHLMEALKRFPALETIVMDPGSYRVPTDMAEAMSRLQGDPYNLQLCSQLLQEMGHRFPARPFSGAWSAPENGGATKDRRLLRRAARAGFGLAIRAAKKVQGSRWRIAVHDLDCSELLLWPLLRATKFQALPARIPETWSHECPGPVFDDRRNGLGGVRCDSEVERLAVRLLPQNFPTLYLEGYQAARAETRRRGPVPPVMISAAAWYFDEPFKFLAAEASQAGTRLVAVQHGGGYGVFRFSAPELHETRVSDAFMAWGWAEQQPGRGRNLPHPKLSSFAAKFSRDRARAADGILFVATGYPRYLSRFQSTPAGSQWTEYIDWQLRFLTHASSAVRASMVFRPYAHDYGHGLRARISEQFPGVRWENGASMADRLRDSRLVVIDHLGTTVLETLALNIPTILFWDPHRWEVRPEAAGEMDRLREAGILHDSPEQAAAAVARASEQSDWWASAPVQEARRRFVERFALVRDNWAACWAGALREMMHRPGSA